MKILGIDPGLAITGYGLIEAQSSSKIKLVEAGVIRTLSSNAISLRLKKIYNNLEDLIKES